MTRWQPACRPPPNASDAFCQWVTDGRAVTQGVDYMGDMSLRTRPSAPPPRLDGDAEYARWAGMRRAVLAARDEWQRQLDLLSIDALKVTTKPLPAHLRERERALRAAAPKATAAKPPADDELPATIRRAFDLLDGRDVPAEPDRASTFARLRREHQTLQVALRAIDGHLDEIRADRSAALAEEMRPRHQAALRAIFEAAEELAAAMDAERAMIAAILASGHSAPEHILRRPFLPAAARLGSASEFDSELNRYRRILQDQKVLS